MCGWLPTKTKAPLHFLIHRATVWGWKTPRDQGPWLKFGFPHLSGNLTSSRQAARKLENNRGRPRMSRAGASRENCSLMGILHDCAPCVGSGCHWNCQKMSKVDCDGALWCHNLQIIPRSSLSCCAWILWPLPYDVPPDHCPLQGTTANVFSRRVSQPRRFVLKLETPGPHDPLPLASAALLPL